LGSNSEEEEKVKTKDRNTGRLGGEPQDDKKEKEFGTGMWKVKQRDIIK